MPFRGIQGQLLTGEARRRWIEKNSQAKMGERNPQWKGDLVGYGSLHDWIKSRLPKPTLCQNCGVRPALDCANKSGKYKRDLSDWWWICRRCHMGIDGRLATLKNIKQKSGWYRVCPICDSTFWVIPSKWNRGTGRYCSKKCSNIGRKSSVSLPEMFRNYETKGKLYGMPQSLLWLPERDSKTSPQPS